MRYLCNQVIADDDPKSVDEGYEGAIQRLVEILTLDTRQRLYKSGLCFLEDLLEWPESDLAKLPEMTAAAARGVVGRLKKIGQRLPSDEEAGVDRRLDNVRLATWIYCDNLHLEKEVNEDSE